MVAIKVFFRSQCRRVSSAPNDLAGFKRYLHEIAGRSDTDIKYKDEEGDMITISLDSEYEDYLSSCKGVATFYVELEINLNGFQNLSASESASSVRSILISDRREMKFNDDDLDFEDLNIEAADKSQFINNERNSNPGPGNMRNLVKAQINGNNERKLDSSQHFGIHCGSCYQSPIIGIRYKCSVCNLNLCSACEESADHDHPFYKVRAPEEEKKVVNGEYNSKALRFIREKLAGRATAGGNESKVEENIRRLVEYGFAKEKVVPALSYSNNDFQIALNSLLQNSK